MPYATIGMGCLAKISYGLGNVEKKLMAVKRIVGEIKARGGEVL